jgi:zinc transporter, ZIP family
LLIGAVIGLYVGPSQRVISAVMAVGAGLLISSVLTMFATAMLPEAYEDGGVVVGVVTTVGFLVTFVFSHLEW